MMEVDIQVESDHLSKVREQTLRCFVQELTRESATTIYEDYGGVIGNMMLKPNWMK